MAAMLYWIFGMVAVVGAYASTDDKFIKKYAMMKIYESCYGVDVVKEIRREMKAACAKCAALSERVPPPPMVYPSRFPPNLVAGYTDNRPPQLNKLGEFGPDRLPNDISQFQHQQQQPQQHPGGPPLIPMQQQNVDMDKLQQALASFYLQQQQAQEQFRQPSLGFGYPSPLASPYSTFPWLNAAPMQYPYYLPIYRNRMSREMDYRSRLDILTARSSGKVRNVTCVMQELGYLDENLEPNFEKIAERIDNLPVSNELKSDMQEGLQFCQKFSSCVPETKRENSPLSKELIKPMFFFRCYKHKKLEACVMKDVRDRFSTNEDDFDTDSDFRAMSRVGRVLKPDELPEKSGSEDTEDIAVSIFDFLYGRTDTDFDSLI